MTMVPSFVDPSGKNGNEHSETEKFIWQIFIFCSIKSFIQVELFT